MELKGKLTLVDESEDGPYIEMRITYGLGGFPPARKFSLIPGLLETARRLVGKAVKIQTDDKKIVMEIEAIKSCL